MPSDSQSRHTNLTTSDQLLHRQDHPHPQHHSQRPRHPPRPPSILSSLSHATNTTTPSTGVIMRRAAAFYGTDEGVARLQADPGLKPMYETVAHHYLTTYGEPKGGEQQMDIEDGGERGDKGGKKTGAAFLLDHNNNNENNNKNNANNDNNINLNNAQGPNTNDTNNSPQIQTQPQITTAAATLIIPQPVPSSPWPVETADDLDKITDNILYWQVMVARHGAEHRKRGIKGWGPDWVAEEQYAVECLSVSPTSPRRSPPPSSSAPILNAPRNHGRHTTLGLCVTRLIRPTVANASSSTLALPTSPIPLMRAACRVPSLAASSPISTETQTGTLLASTISVAWGSMTPIFHLFNIYVSASAISRDQQATIKEKKARLSEPGAQVEGPLTARLDSSRENPRGEGVGPATYPDPTYSGHNKARPHRNLDESLFRALSGVHQTFDIQERRQWHRDILLFWQRVAMARLRTASLELPELTLVNAAYAFAFSYTPVHAPKDMVIISNSFMFILTYLDTHKRALGDVHVVGPVRLHALICGHVIYVDPRNQLFSQKLIASLSIYLAKTQGCRTCPIISHAICLMSLFDLNLTFDILFIGRLVYYEHLIFSISDVLDLYVQVPGERPDYYLVYVRGQSRVYATKKAEESGIANRGSG
ncbi:hypothetical protein CHU98_g10664 [Xylaria longipes]|nr:hypothetical protein CHU98_g10664 [Xylaria longipes]